MINTILLALHAAVIILSDQSKLCVTASPVPISFPRTHLAADHLLRTDLNATQDASLFVTMGSARRNILRDFRSSSLAIATHPSTTHPLPRRDDLLHYYKQAEENRNNLRMYVFLV